jgi:PIN domain nuclease of toxin-antitoxin system
MKYLIDTHILIWFLEGNVRLSKRAKNLIIDTDNQIFVSIASLWEMTIKMSIGKLKLSKTLPEIIEQMESDGINILSIQEEHLKTLLALPFHHNDPFDRLLVAQVQTENLVLVTDDTKFNLYNINILN